LAKRGSRSDPVRPRSGWHLASLLLFLCAAWPLAARPVVAEFTNSAADARSFQPLRLTTDLGGRERPVQLTLDLPPGARLASAPARFIAGGRPHVQVLNIYVPGGTVAGAFTVRGVVRDGLSAWPFTATIRVRATARLVVRDEDVGFSTVRAEESVHRTWRVTNTGNVPLDLRNSAQPTTGTVLTVDPARLTLAPGQNGEVVLTARLEATPDRLLSLPLFLNVDSGVGGQRRRETVGFTAEFVPREAGTGPLFAELAGEVLAGGVIARDHRGAAGRLHLAGEILPNLHLTATGTDGTAAPGGSRLGLASRDYLTVDLSGRTWRATGGLVDAPSFGFLEPSPQGRGGTLTWSDASGLALTALGMRERFGDFSRTHAGLHAAQGSPDQAGWAAGLLAQSNQAGPAPRQERIGGFIQAQWRWRDLAGTSQLAAAHDSNRGAARIGLEQRLDYQTKDERSSVALFAQEAPAGFFLDGRSLQLRDAAAALATTATGRLILHWSDSRQRGQLRSYAQTEIEAGLVPTDPRFVELITRSASAARSRSAGYEFAAGDSRARLTFSDTRRTRETSLGPGVEPSYREQAAAADFSRTLHQGRLFLTSTLTAGTEAVPGAEAGFAEFAASAGGALFDTVQFSTEVRHTRRTHGSETTGYRQPGTYGRGSLLWIPRPRWRVEAGFDAYQYATFASRTRSYAVLELPVTARTSLATEVSHDNQRTSLWLAARVNFKARLPWRPLRGALAGRVRIGGSLAPLPGARLDLDGRAGLTDGDGRFTLPGRPPGTYPFTWSLPAEYQATADWPREIQLRAGKVQQVELIAARLAALEGTVSLTRGTEVIRPTGAVSATDADGQVFETVAAAGEFKLLLPPGRYTVRYTGEIAADLADQLVAIVQIGPAGESVAVRLQATAAVRALRRTFFQDLDAPGRSPPPR
jgi:hypothetical protein